MEKSSGKSKGPLSERIRDKRGDTPRSNDPEVIKRELANAAKHEEFATQGALLRALRRVIEKH